MIFGNPSEFAIQIELIPEWCNANFREGLFCVYLNRQRLSDSSAHCDTLNIDTSYLLNSFSSTFAEMSKPVPLIDALIGKSHEDIFSLLYDLTYPADATDKSVNNCWDYVISPFAMSDRGFHLFIYKDGSSEVLSGGSIDSGIVASRSMPLGSTFAIAKAAAAYASSL